jgi:hypothetical protein
MLVLGLISAVSSWTVKAFGDLCRWVCFVSSELLKVEGTVTQLRHLRELPFV